LVSFSVKSSGDVQEHLAKLRVGGRNGLEALLRTRRPEGRFCIAEAPRPGVSEPQRGEDVQRRRIRAAVRRRDADQRIVRASLRVLDKDVEITVIVEDARIEQLILHLAAAAAPVGLDQVFVRKRALRVLVEPLHVGVGRRGIEVEVVLLHVLAVVALAVGQAEQALLEDGVFPVPEREGKAEALPVVRVPGQSVLAPSVRARPGVIVAEIVPCVAALAVVLADGAPLPFAQVRTPFAPCGASLCFLQPFALQAHSRLLMLVLRIVRTVRHSGYGSAPGT
jgi:hypothetical protein